MEQYEKLRREYPRFYYHGYEAEWGEEALNITYTFEIEGYRFSPLGGPSLCPMAGRKR